MNTSLTYELIIKIGIWEYRASIFQVLVESSEFNVTVLSRPESANVEF